jgi:hypothetical protein
MEDWYREVRNLRDISEEPYKTEDFCHFIWHSLNTMRIKKPEKFKQKIGPEFDSWTHSLEDRFEENLIKPILNNDGFWLLTYETARHR